jgi:hypothetical protein
MKRRRKLEVLRGHIQATFGNGLELHVMTPGIGDSAYWPGAHSEKEWCPFRFDEVGMHALMAGQGQTVQGVIDRIDAELQRMLPDLSRTRRALDAYDANPTDHNSREVGEAYGTDTMDRNDPAVCAAHLRPGPKIPGPGCELSFVRRMVQKWENDD